MEKSQETFLKPHYNCQLLCRKPSGLLNAHISFVFVHHLLLLKLFI